MAKLNSHCSICGKVHLNVCQHYNEGKNPYVALVFESPRSEEEKHGKPIYGETGDYFEQILGKLHYDKVFKNYLSKYDFRITNALCEVIEPKNPNFEKKMMCSDNIQRLFEELEDTINCNGVIICFGDKAKDAVDAVIKTHGVSIVPITTKCPSTVNFKTHGYSCTSIAQDIRNGLNGKTISAKL